MLTASDLRSSAHVAQLCEVERETSCRVSLEKTVIDQRAAKLQREALRLARQRAFLREERKRAREEEAAIAADNAALDHVKKDDWWPSDYLVGAGNPDDRLRLRVGGQIFEIAKSVLQQDKASLLSALCSPDCPLFQFQGEVDRDQTVVIDRDWWLFRFITIFLRDGLVPEDRCTALQLYREAAFWRLESLQRAIEETHLNLARTDICMDGGALKESQKEDNDKFWKSKKNWWESQVKKEESSSDAPQPEWWMDYGEVTAGGGGLKSINAEYKGSKFGPLSTDPGKVTAGYDDDGKGDDDAKPMYTSTWGYYCR